VKKEKVIYRHIKPCGEVFYIGIGTKKRPYNTHNRSAWWNKVVKKYGYEIDIMKTNLSLEEAKELEMYLISYYGRRDKGKGTLVNLTDGGEGAAGSKHALGYKHTKEEIEKRRHANAKKVINTETKEILKSGASLYRKYKIWNDRLTHKSPSNDWMYLCDYKKGKHLTEEWINRYRINNKSTKIINIETKEIYYSIGEVYSLYSSKYFSLVGKLNRGTSNTSDFMYYSDYLEGKHLTEEWKNRKTRKRTPRKMEDYIIYELYDLKTNQIIKGNSIEIEKITKCKIHQTLCMNKGRYILTKNLKDKHKNKWRTILNIKTGEKERYNQIRFANQVNAPSNNVSSFFRGRGKAYKNTYIIISDK